MSSLSAEVVELTKCCNKCKQSKPIVEFSVSYSKYNHERRINNCRDCVRNYRRKYEDDNRDIIKEKKKKWRLEERKKNILLRTNNPEVYNKLKICTKCKIEKISANFPINARGKFAAQCKVCANQRQAKYKAKYLARPGYRQYLNKLQKEWNSKRPRDVKRYEYVFQKYGLSKESYDAILQVQNSECAICFIKLDMNAKKLPAVDHNHKTGDVRGILCHGCNSGLGHFKENCEALISAASYLKKHGR